MEKEIGFCGEECYKCDLRIATLTHADDAAKEQIAAKVNTYLPDDVPPESRYTKEDIYCTGCHAKQGQCEKLCAECIIRPCGIEKGVEHCGKCSDYPCEIIEKIFPKGSELRIRTDKLASINEKA